MKVWVFKNLFFVFLSVLVFLGGIWVLPQAEHTCWFEISFLMLLIYMGSSLIPAVFSHPLWPVLYRNVLRFLGASVLFYVYYFHLFPRKTQIGIMIFVYYFLFIFTDIFHALRFRI